MVVKSKIEIKSKRGKIKIGDEGRCTTLIPLKGHDGKIPVWWNKHQTPFYHFPIWMLPTEIDFVRDIISPDTKTT